MNSLKEVKKRVIYFLIIGLVLSIFLNHTLAAPVGVDPNVINSTRDDGPDPTAVAVQAGNVTEITIEGFQQTSTWAGFFGNITGAVQLSDADGNVFYNWTPVSGSGEIYASNGTVNWNNVQCFNFTATGTYENYGADAQERGQTNLYGKNLSLLEAEFGILPIDSDGVNETFSDTPHSPFAVNGLSFSNHECLATYIFDDTGKGTEGNFEETLLWDPDNNNTIFTSLLEDSESGFDDNEHDFEIMVLEDGHSPYVQTTNYYFYVEIS